MEISKQIGLTYLKMFPSCALAPTVIAGKCNTRRYSVHGKRLLSDNDIEKRAHPQISTKWKKA